MGEFLLLAGHADEIQTCLNIFLMWRCHRALSTFRHISQLPLVILQHSPSSNWCARFPWTLIEAESGCPADRRVDRLVPGRSPSAAASTAAHLCSPPRGRAHARRSTQGLVSSRPLGFGVNSTAPMLVCSKCGTIHRGAPGSIDTVC